MTINEDPGRSSPEGHLHGECNEACDGILRTHGLWRNAANICSSTGGHFRCLSSTIYSSALPQFYPAALNHNLQDPRSVSSYFESPSGSILVHMYSSAQSKGIVLHFSFPRLHRHVKFRKPFHELTSISMDMQSNSCQMKQRLGA